MKPIFLTSPNRSGRDLFDPIERKHRPMPVTDYSYHSVAFGGFSGRKMRNPAQSFWNIAGDYLKDEARHDFWTEATLFAFITIAAALPLMNNLHALIEFMRAITSQGA
jgi:hypothetical protein